MAYRLPDNMKKGSAHLPDGGHGKVQLHKDGTEGQQASRKEEHGGVAGPVRRRDVPRDLVGTRRVGRHLLLGGQYSACKAAHKLQPVQTSVFLEQNVAV